MDNIDQIFHGVQTMWEEHFSFDKNRVAAKSALYLRSTFRSVIAMCDCSYCSSSYLVRLELKSKVLPIACLNNLNLLQRDLPSNEVL